MKLLPKILPTDEFSLLDQAQLFAKIIDYDHLNKPLKRQLR